MGPESNMEFLSVQLHRVYGLKEILCNHFRLPDHDSSHEFRCGI